MKKLREAWPAAVGPAPSFTALNAMQCHDSRGIYGRILASIHAHGSKAKDIPSYSSSKEAEEALVRLVTGTGKPGKKSTGMQ